MYTKHCRWCDLVDDWTLINVEELSTDDAEVIGAIEYTADGQYVHNNSCHSSISCLNEYLATYIYGYMNE